MGMTGESLEGYIRQERLKYGAEAMREVQQHAEMPGFDEDTPVYEACDKQSGVIDILAAPGGVKLMGYNGQWVAVWRENGFIPMTGTIRPQRWTSSWMVLPLAGELTKEEAVRKLREWVPQKQGRMEHFRGLHGCAGAGRGHALGLRRFVLRAADGRNVLSRLYE